MTRRTVEQKLAFVRAVQEKAAGGMSDHEACCHCRVPHATYVRWRDALARGGEAALADRKPTGRPRTRA